jgi:hypothetical protein
MRGKMRRVSFITRVIASILLATFVAQDVVWADPDAFCASAPRHSLQVESKLKPFHTETLLKDRLEISLKLIVRLISNDIENFKLRITYPLKDSNAKLIYDFRNKYKEGDNWIVWCIAVDDTVKYEKAYEAIINSSGEGSIVLREPVTGNIIQEETDISKPSVTIGELYEKKF